MEKNGLTRLLLFIVGCLFFITGIITSSYYFVKVKPEKDARELVVEAELAFERGNKESINTSINILSKIIAKYPDTKAAADAYYYIGKGYEKLGLNRLAYLKYTYVLKNNKGLSNRLNREIRARLGRLKVLKQRTEEGVDQLLGLVNYTTNKDFRSRVYAELGHAYLKSGLLKKAKRMFDIAISEDGGNEEAILGKARTFKRMGKDNSAYDLYEYFLRYYSNFSPYAKDVKSSFSKQVYRSGINSYRKGSYYQSIGYFNRFLNNFPGYKKVENSLYWIGENYFALKKYNSAIKYFNRVLKSSYTSKNEDARLKKGYSFFMLRKFDLASREFQLYLNNYPNGKHIKTAKKWKEMSTKEILYRIKSDKVPDDYSDEYDEEEYREGVKDSEARLNNKNKNYGVKGSFEINEPEPEIEFENVAEL